MGTAQPGDLGNHMNTLYTITNRQAERTTEPQDEGDWWYRCKRCGAQAGGYQEEWLVRLMADRHVMNCR
jgi:hypothetical protein